MNKHSLFEQLCPRAGSCWRLLPVIGPLLERFTGWLDRQSYTHMTIRHRLGFLPALDRWLQRWRRVRSLTNLNHQHLNAAHDSLRLREPQIGQAVRSFQRFLQEERLIPQPEGDSPSPSDRELATFAAHLREVRGLAESTIQGHQGRVRPFLSFLRLDRRAVVLARLKLEQIEAFLVQAARGHNRFTLQQIVCSLRAFLRFVHAQGRLARPLHQQIDSPRVYRQEHLPRAWSWEQVRTLLQSIKRSEASGLRDRALLYLAVSYLLAAAAPENLSLPTPVPSNQINDLANYPFGFNGQGQSRQLTVQRLIFIMRPP